MTHYSAQSYQIDDSPGYLIAKVRWMLNTALEREASTLGISCAQVGMLLLIANGKGDTAAALARETEYDTGSMTRMLDRLEGKKLIARKRSRRDRRCVHLQLTAEGKRVAKKLPAIAAKVLNQHLRGFAAAEIELFNSFLRRMLANRGTSAPLGGGTKTARGKS